MSAEDDSASESLNSIRPGVFFDRVLARDAEVFVAALGRVRDGELVGRDLAGEAAAREREGELVSSDFDGDAALRDRDGEVAVRECGCARRSSSRARSCSRLR